MAFAVGGRRAAVASRGDVLWTALIVVLGAYTLLVVGVESTRLALDDLQTRLVLETVIVGVMGGAAVLLALLDRGATPVGRDAFVAALVVQVVVNTVFAVVPALAGEPLTLQRSFYPWLAGRWVAGVLLLLAAVRLRGASVRLAVGAGVVAVVATELAIVALDPEVPVADVAPTQLSGEPASWLLEAGPMAMFAVGAVAAHRAAARSGQPLERWLSVALLVGAFTQVHEALFPAALGSVITSADVLRLLATIALLVGVVAQVLRLQQQRDRAVGLLTEDLARNEASLRTVRDAREREAAFMSVVTHELTSPLAAVNAHAHVLAHLVGEGARGHVDAIRAEAARLGALVERIDELRDLEDPAFAVERRPVAVMPLLHEVAAFGEGLGGHHEVVVVGEPARVDADPVRLGQVLRNLVANAVRYAPEGTPIELRGEVRDRAYRVQVADRGPGLAGEDTDALLRPYTKGRGAVDTGTGLGLHLARRIVEAHGGRIGFVRPEDPGTRVWVEVGLA